MTAVSTHTVPIPGAVDCLQEEATATTDFFEISALSLLGVKLLPLPRNPRSSVIFGSSEKIPSSKAKQTANAHLSANPYLASQAL